MKLGEIKKKMLGFEDFYGQDFVNVDGIKRATSKAKLKEILNSHRRFLEDQNIDAMGHFDDFIKECELEWVEVK